MMSLNQIRSLASKHASRAKRLGIVPLVITESNLKTIRGPKHSPKIPFIGDFVPEGFYVSDRSLFVDSSGMGQAGELALTQEQFLGQLEIGKAYAIIEAGQFQVVVGVFGVNGE